MLTAAWFACWLQRLGHCSCRVPQPHSQNQQITLLDNTRKGLYVETRPKQLCRRSSGITWTNCHPFQGVNSHLAEKPTLGLGPTLQVAIPMLASFVHERCELQADERGYKSSCDHARNNANEPCGTRWVPNRMIYFLLPRSPVPRLMGVAAACKNYSG